MKWLLLRRLRKINKLLAKVYWSEKFPIGNTKEILDMQERIALLIVKINNR